MFQSLMPNIMVESVDETVEFYIQKLSFSLMQTVKNEEGKLNFAILSKDNCVLSFQLKSNLIEEYKTLSTDIIKPSLTLFFTVEDVNVVYEEFKQKTTIASELHTTFYKTKEFSVFDNNGNILTIAGQS